MRTYKAPLSFGSSLGGAFNLKRYMATFPGGQASVPVFNKENLPISRAEVMALVETGGGGTTTVIGSGGTFGGIGSPEGVLDAPKYSQYYDESVGQLYVKTTDSGVSTGWL